MLIINSIEDVMDISNDCVKNTLKEEGFSSTPYLDENGVWTIGHGITLLTKEASEAAVVVLLLQAKKQIYQRIKHLSPARQDVLIQMAYNLGVSGLYGFVNTWKAIESDDFDTAADEIMDSDAARKLHNRYYRLSESMRRG